ncbi:MAG: hypothetical protein R3281_03285 [Balneolaceae bacterium]|nr:hypothetical protein [Balneolaceae bacterium]
MSNTPLQKLCLIIVTLLVVADGANSQESRSYEFIPYPDIWYNDVDGIRLGARVVGQVPGTFNDGPHRLHAGVWIGTWWPELPVSYYLDFTEPIPAISAFNSEGNLQLVSSVRTGLSRHSLRFNKRWQQGFDQRSYQKLTVGVTAQQLIDAGYPVYRHLWQQEWLWLGTVSFRKQGDNRLGFNLFSVDLAANLAGEAPSFSTFRLIAKQGIALGKGFHLRSRFFGGIASDNTVPEMLFGRSFRQADRWVGSSLVRAKGTIPAAWMGSGTFQVTGGANLRGYTNQDITALEQGAAPLLTSIGAINLELDYPNPIDRAIRKVPAVGDLVRLRSYLFNDTGTSLGFTEREESRVLSDAGAGFALSLNIPDNLGNPRGLELRYDIPLWVSHASSGNNFAFRSVIGLGAIFTL